MLAPLGRYWRIRPLVFSLVLDVSIRVPRSGPSCDLPPPIWNADFTGGERGGEHGLHDRIHVDYRPPDPTETLMKDEADH